MKFNNSMINHLKDLALKSNMKIKLAAGLFYSKKGFIATGFNTTRTYSKNTIKPSEHAECAALRELKKYPNINPKDLKLVVIRIGLSGSLLQSTPCMNCVNTILTHGIKKVYYINETNDIVCKRINELCSFRKECPYRNITTTNLWFEEVNKIHSIFSETAKVLKNKEKTNFTLELGEKIETLRILRNLSQKELATVLAIPIKSLILIEKGKEKFTSVVFSKFVRYFGNVIAL